MVKTSSEPAPVAKQFVLSTTELLTRFADYNPRIHTDEDIAWTADSLLTVGWATTLCLNLKSGTIVGGHGRALAADMMRTQDAAWFKLKLDELIETHPDWAKMVSQHQPRFTPGFWESCPCIGIDVDESTERSTNIRLNSTTREGKNDPAKVASLLSTLNQRQQDHAGFDKKTAQGFIAAYLETAPDSTPAVDFQPKQYFERPDATVYNQDGEPVSQEEVQAMDVIPGDWKVAIDGEAYNSAELEELYAEEEFSPDIALDDLNLDELSEGFRCANVDRDVAETRIVLLVSKVDLEAYRIKIPTIAKWLGIDILSMPAKQWRPKAIVAMVNMAYEQAAAAGITPIPPTQDDDEDASYAIDLDD